MSSESQITANRANAALSTGPVTEAGKAVSSHNALKTGLTGRTILLPTDDREIYQQHVARFFTKYKPATDEETTLTQAIADTEWRLLRIPGLESGIYATGRRRFANEYADEPDPAVRAGMIEAEVFQNCRKDLSNLALQEARLRRMREADVAALQELIQARAGKKSNDMANAAITRRQVLNAGNAFDPTLFGFEFTNAELIDYDEIREARQFARGEHSKFSKADYQRYMQRHSAQSAAEKDAVTVEKEQKAA